MSAKDQQGPGWTPRLRLEGKVAVVFGAGQSPGEGLGNGRAAALRFAREGRARDCSQSLDRIGRGDRRR